jgi:ABC-2 type transport system ATP-binding protein
LAVIEVSSLKKAYGSLQAVDSISFTIDEGQVFSLLGPNGAGKTTTIEILEGLREKDSGEVKVLGMDPWKDGGALHRRIGVIPQGFTFLPYITPKEAISYYANLFDVKVDAEEILERVILQDSASVHFEKLSGGQKQKVGLALALVNRPDFVFLDEPTTGLDPQARRAVWDVIRNLKREGISVMLTTHYLEEAEELADKVAIMNRGKIITAGTPNDIIVEYGSGEKVRVNGSQALADYIRANTGLGVTYADGLVSVTLKKKEDALPVLEAIGRSGLEWSNLTMRHDSLEDVFVRLVGSKISDEGQVARVG